MYAPNVTTVWHAVCSVEGTSGVRRGGCPTGAAEPIATKTGRRPHTNTLKTKQLRRSRHSDVRPELDHRLRLSHGTPGPNQKQFWMFFCIQ